jgi:hypothetical protein
MFNEPFLALLTMIVKAVASSGPNARLAFGEESKGEEVRAFPALLNIGPPRRIEICKVWVVLYSKEME